MIPMNSTLPESPSAAPQGAGPRAGRPETGAEHPVAPGGKATAGRGAFAEILRRMDAEGWPGAARSADGPAGNAPARGEDTEEEQGTSEGQLADIAPVPVEDTEDPSAAPSVPGPPAVEMSEDARGGVMQEGPEAVGAGSVPGEQRDGTAALAANAGPASPDATRPAGDGPAKARPEGFAATAADPRINGLPPGSGRNDPTNPRALTGQREEAAPQRSGLQADAAAEAPQRHPGMTAPQELRASRLTHSDTMSAPSATEPGRGMAVSNAPAAPIFPPGAVPVPPPPGGHSSLQVVGHVAAEEMADRGTAPLSGLDVRTAAPHPSGQAAPPRAEAAAVLRQLAEALSAAPVPGSVEVSLNPPELGRVRLSFAPSDAGIAVLIQAERPETLDLMRRHADQLAQEFRAMGYGSTSFAFGQDTGAPPRRPEDIAGASGASPAEEMAPPATQEAPRRGVLAGLDLRL